MKNYHTHTYRCYHAMGTEEEYILAAIKSGYTTLGFSDHSPWKYNSDFHAHMRMEADKLPGYVETLNQLRDKYKDQIHIYIGLECEYFPMYMDWLKEMIDLYHIDYIIMGNHYIDSDEINDYIGYNCNRNDLKTYVDRCIEGLQTGLYSYIAHPDLANYRYIHDKYYDQQMRRLCNACKEYDIPVEFNCLGYKGNRNYPNDVFFTIAAEVGVKAIIGLDAHDTEAILDTSTFKYAKKYLEAKGLEVVDRIKLINGEYND